MPLSFCVFFIAFAVQAHNTDRYASPRMEHLRCLRHCPLFALRNTVDWTRRWRTSEISGGMRDVLGDAEPFVVTAAGRAVGVSSSGGGVPDRLIVPGVLGMHDARGVRTSLYCLLRLPKLVHVVSGLMDGIRPMVFRSLTLMPQGKRPNIRLVRRSAHALRTTNNGQVSTCSSLHMLCVT